MNTERKIYEASTIKLAIGILRAIKMRTDSYDQEAARLAAEASEAARSAPNASMFDGFVDYNKFYRVSLLTACAAAGELQMPVYMLLISSWNDAYDWATEVLAKGGIDLEKMHP